MFVEDISVPDMIYALTIRSPACRGVIKDIECPKLPHGYFLIKAEDIPGKNNLVDLQLPILADKYVEYIGQPTAILAGPDETKLEELAAGIKVTIEENSELIPGGPLNDVIVKREIISGDHAGIPADEIIQSEESGLIPGIITGVYATGIQEHWYSEATGAVAIPPKAKGESNLTIYTATQWIYHVRRSAARVLGWNPNKIAVRAACITTHLDGKIWYPSLIACQAALAAVIVNKPVKLLLSRGEDFLYSPKRNGSEIRIQSSIGEKGEIISSSIKVKLNLGAQAVFKDEIIDHTCLAALGAYSRRSFRIDGEGILSQIPPQGVMAGFGLSQGFFAAETHVSEIADSLSQDPAEWRKNNYITNNQSLLFGSAQKDIIPIAELIDAAAAMSDYYRKWASYELLRRRRGAKWSFTGEPLRGIGISTAFQGSGFLYNNESGNGNCEVEMTLEKDGSLEIKTSLSSSFNVYPDTWKDMIQEILGVEHSMIRLTNAVPEAPDSGPGTLSRNISLLTKLVERCCSAIRKQRFRDPLPITVKRAVKNIKKPGLNNGLDINPDAFSSPSWGCSIIEVEIEPVSLEPLIRGIWLVVDGGKILSQRRARQTLRTGIIHALGWACREQIYYEDGKIPYELYLGYDIPSPGEIPPIHVDFIWNDTAEPRGIGELPFCTIPAAYVQAVSQAMDYPFRRIPLDMRDIWEAGRQKLSEAPQ